VVLLAGWGWDCCSAGGQNPKLAGTLLNGRDGINAMEWQSQELPPGLKLHRAGSRAADLLHGTEAKQKALANNLHQGWKFKN
jgi:hypothetical protein